MFLHRLVINSISEDLSFKDLYEKTKNKFSEKYPELKDKLPKHFGFGIGYEFRERMLVISPKNTNRIKRENVFAVITSLKELQNSNKHKYSIHLSDTVILNNKNEIENITSEVGIEFDDIGYDISEEPKNEYKMPVEVNVNAPWVSRA